MPFTIATIRQWGTMQLTYKPTQPTYYVFLEDKVEKKGKKGGQSSKSNSCVWEDPSSKQRERTAQEK